jgi:anti-sigma factor ChrR (cupin superfamily)
MKALKQPHLPDFSSDERPQDRALRLGAERLRLAVGALPLRYAPFFGRLSELWQLPEVQVVGELTRAADPKRWRRTVLRGLRTFTLELPEPNHGERAHLLRFEPGLTFPSHQHRGAERVLVLEGAYADDSGGVVRAGDEQRMAPGSEHALHILGDAPCVAAVSEQGISFVAPWLGRLFDSWRR